MRGYAPGDCNQPGPTAFDYTNGTAPAAETTTTDRLRDMADSAGDQLQHVAENAQETAAKVTDQARE
jgi:hypothetical protein